MSTFLWKAVKVAALLTLGQPEEQYTPPVYQPEDYQPVFQPPPHRPPPSQRYRPSPHRPPLSTGTAKIQGITASFTEDDQTDQPADEYYNGLRAHASKEGDEMSRCFSESHEAYDRGDHAAAKELSNQGKNHKQKMEQLHKAASTWIYLENNRGREPGEIDLHGLYVKEAIAYTETALEEASLRGDSELRVIVGRGSHSEDGVARVRPAIEELMRQHRLITELDPSNSGVLVVELNGR
ncbi:hypothetical protein F5146DRAFT_1228904 [Armillaria mellea]|nr:hypothetical protein F5146DRAFT_1228904 [Armillaria mellea]